jgi:hypothetical protein
MTGSMTSLAETSGVGYVRLCACGSINLNIGAITLHIKPDAFLRVAAMAQQAATTLLIARRNDEASSMGELHDSVPGQDLVN